MGSETLHTQHGIAAIPAGTKIVTDAGLEVPPRVESTAPARLYLNAFQTLAEAALALGLEPEPVDIAARSDEHTSELQSLMRISYAVFSLKQKKHNHTTIPK